MRLIFSFLIHLGKINLDTLSFRSINLDSPVYKDVHIFTIRE